MSATHRVHPDEARGDPPGGALLYDNCERCDEQAADALGLDRTKLRAAWDIMLAVEISDAVHAHYATRNTARLGRVLYNVYVINERLARR